MTVPPQRKEDSRARFTNAEWGSPTIAWCTHSSSFVSTLGIQGKPRRVQAIREESTKSWERQSPCTLSRTLWLCCPGVFRWSAGPQRLHYHGGNPKAFPDRGTRKTTRSLEAFEALVHSMDTHKQADRGHRQEQVEQVSSKMTGNPMVTNRTTQELTWYRTPRNNKVKMERQKYWWEP